MSGVLKGKEGCPACNGNNIEKTIAFNDNLNMKICNARGKHGNEPDSANKKAIIRNLVSYPGQLKDDNICFVDHAETPEEGLGTWTLLSVKEGRK